MKIFLLHFFSLAVMGIVYGNMVLKYVTSVSHWPVLITGNMAWFQDYRSKI